MKQEKQKIANTLFNNFFYLDLIKSKKLFLVFVVLPLVFISIFDYSDINNIYFSIPYFILCISPLIYFLYRFYYFLRYESKSLIK